ncbi:50S ribosomal protein L37ae [Candidatus Woesearchaeota archaeon]|nr:50S ribosomal protein L37ae [Candidatus Woesearchaeota archaeon]
MVETVKGMGSVKRFGTRYGRTTKYKLAKIEVEQRKKQDCPYCGKAKVRRVSYGIWNCQKCHNTFTARAYNVGKKLTLQERASQLVAEAPEIRTIEGEE